MIKLKNANGLDYALGCCEHLGEFTDLLKQHFGITLFGYLRIFFDNKHLYLSSNKQLVLDHITRVNSAIIFGKRTIGMVGSSKYEFIPWPTSPSHYSMELYLKHRYWNGFSILKRNTSDIELWWFAADIDNTQINDAYIKYAAVFEKFVHYFNNKSRNLLDTSDKTKLCQFSEGVDFSNIENFASENEKNNIQNFLDKVRLTQCEVYTKNGKVVLSSREMDCLRLMSEGKIMKEMAYCLNISPKTVESYINKAKSKTGYFCRSDLVKLYNEQIASLEKVII